MEALYRPILKKSWEIVKKYKFLWPLGFLAAFLGNTGDLKFFFDLTANVNEQPVIWQNLKDYFFRPGLINFLQLFSNTLLLNQLIVIIFLTFCLALLIFIIWLIISAQAGLINGVYEVENQKKGNFWSNFTIGTKFFGPVFGLNLLAKLIAFLVLTFLILPLIIITKNSQFSLAVAIIDFLIFLPLVIIINFVTKYAVAYVVIDGKKFNQALFKGWQLFLNNWLISLEMAILILLINVLASFLFIIILLIIISPIFIILFFSGLTFYFYFLGFITVILLFLLLAFFGAVLSTFQTTVWTLLFLKIRKSKFFSKLERLTYLPKPSAK